MNRKYKIGLAGLGIVGVIVVGGWYLSGVNIPVLDPKGTIGAQEKQLMVFALTLSLIVVIPVFVMLFGFAWRYRASNPRPAKYAPHWDHSVPLEAVWWLIPLILITILSVVTWESSHRLDPFRPLQADDRKSLKVQVIALNWKWLFIYPEQGVASVNSLIFPEKTPVDFTITADAPMNSFWIPQLGGQVYAMPGMSTELHLQADHQGTYRGSSANISGAGFAGMTFQAEAVNEAAFERWALKTSQAQELTLPVYDRLAQPSTNNKPAYYSLKEKNLYDIVVMKYMHPIQGASGAGADTAGARKQ